MLRKKEERMEGNGGKRKGEREKERKERTEWKS